MPLELPGDLEPYVGDYEDMHLAGAYALALQRPVDLRQKWHEYYDTKPPYWSGLLTADRVFYVGGTGDLLGRLEDHRDGEVRQTALTRVCDITGLHTAWVAKSPDHAREVVEPRLARWLASSNPGWYCHTR